MGYKIKAVNEVPRSPLMLIQIIFTT